MVKKKKMLTLQVCLFLHCVWPQPPKAAADTLSLGKYGALSCPSAQTSFPLGCHHRGSLQICLGSFLIF